MKKGFFLIAAARASTLCLGHVLITVRTYLPRACWRCLQATFCGHGSYPRGCEKDIFCSCLIKINTCDSAIFVSSYRNRPYL
ncbi:hypothetical protein BDY21DRAFT_334018 [Lineolata rhizophorae]|uniref:Uncharacterized protein n=1 Tax=Lineolata rhizophorae TaxID=578093 RepID=A0A6A6PAX3_9PEZI|nr:hypothetical protein BDY21DRAFT_334018 [Lineolata rhizophorae]